jgi:glycosyltransferase involved in cell wall biosynthesis
MSEHLKKNIEILKQQDYQNFEVYFGDDLSTDNSCEIIEENIKNDRRFYLIKHKEKLFSMGNIYTTIKIANPSDEDIIVLVDGDDALADCNVLSYLKKTYEQKKCFMTYGSYSVNGIINPLCRPYSSLVVKFNLFRFVRWRASHLKTFKYKLWKKINKKDMTITSKEFNSVLIKTLLKGKISSWKNFKKINYPDLVTSNKEFVRRCDDKVFTLPMLEMAGEKAVFIAKDLYHYQAQGAHDFGTSDRKWAQRFIRAAAFMKTCYKKW